jgi:hypothetical protein
MKNREKWRLNIRRPKLTLSWKEGSISGDNHTAY